MFNILFLLLLPVQFYCVHSAGLDGRLGQSWGDSGHWCYKQTWLYRPGTQEAWTLWPGVSVQPAGQEGETEYKRHNWIQRTHEHELKQTHLLSVFFIVGHQIQILWCNRNEGKILQLWDNRKDHLLYIQCNTHMHTQQETQWTAEVICVLRIRVLQ